MMGEASSIGPGFRVEFLGKLTQNLCGALIVVGLARLLTPDDYGLLFLTISFITIVISLSKTGVDRSAARYISEYKERDQGQIRYIIRDSLVFLVTLTSLFSIGILIGNQYIADALGEPELVPFLLLSVGYLLFMSLTLFCRKVLQGLEDIRSAAYISIIQGVSNLVFVIGFVLLGFGALGALLGYVIPLVITTAFGFTVIYTQYYASIPSANEMEAGLRRRIAEYSIPLTASEMADKLDKDIDTVLIGYFLNPVAVSYYVIGKHAVTFVEVPINALGFTVAPTLGSERAAGNAARARDIYEDAFIKALVFYSPAAAGLILVADPMIGLVFGDQYLGAVPVLQILGVYTLIRAVSRPTNEGLNFLGRAKERAVVKGITSIMNFGLNVLLIPWIGVVGAALATVFTYSIYAFTNIYLIHQELDIRFGHLGRHLLKSFGITLVMSGVVFVLLDFISGLITLALVVSTGVVVWAILSIAVGILDPRELYRELAQ